MIKPISFKIKPNKVCPLPRSSFAASPLNANKQYGTHKALHPHQNAHRDPHEAFHQTLKASEQTFKATNKKRKALNESHEASDEIYKASFHQQQGI